MSNKDDSWKSNISYVWAPYIPVYEGNLKTNLIMARSYNRMNLEILKKETLGHLNVKDVILCFWNEFVTQHFPENEEQCYKSLENILGNYSKLNRHYHNLNHLAFVLTWLGYIGSITSEVASIKKEHLSIAMVAAFYHDVVYNFDNEFEKNEEKSAYYAIEDMEKIGFSQHIQNQVFGLILQTQNNNLTYSNWQMADDWYHKNAVLHDADYLILASGSGKYLEYAENIRKEGQNFAIAHTEWKLGRLEFIKNTMMKKQIFLHPQIYSEFEWTARKNLEEEYHRWDGPTFFGKIEDWRKDEEKEVSKDRKVRVCPTCKQEPAKVKYSDPPQAHCCGKEQVLIEKPSD